MKGSLKILFVIVALLAAVSSCGEDGKKLKINEGVAARIGNKKISNEEVDMKLDQLPPQQKDDFKGESGRAKLVDMIINEELLYLDAKSKNLSNDRDVKEQLEAAEKRILLTVYFNKVIMEDIEVSDDEIERYYNGNQAAYTNLALYKAQHVFSTDSMKCVEWKKRIDGGEKLSAIAQTESEDLSTKADYGNLGYFNSDGYIKFIGHSSTFTRDIEDLEVGEVSDVIKHERGYSIVRLNDKKPATLKPLSEVRKSIIEKLREEKATFMMDQKLAELRRKYRPENYAREKVMETTRSPEEFWEIAQEEDAPYTRIIYYRELVNKYPDHRYAPQALFMIGFVYSEELHDHVMARKTFDELIRDYPDSDVAESAGWMIGNLNKPHPKFESMEKVKEEMEKEKETE